MEDETTAKHRELVEEVNRVENEHSRARVHLSMLLSGAEGEYSSDHEAELIVVAYEQVKATRRRASEMWTELRKFERDNGLDKGLRGVEKGAYPVAVNILAAPRPE